jgi:two-component system chemotaxis response regulator CheY
MRDVHQDLENGSVKRILVVDDERAMRDLVTEILQDRYAVSVARNGAEALDSIRQQPPDAVVLDMMMPVMDGWTFLMQWRSQPDFARVPVIVVSAEPAACRDGARLGARGWIAKPFTIDQLSTAVEHLFTLTA